MEKMRKDASAGDREWLFLSPEWVHEVTRLVQSARTRDEDFARLAADFSLTLLYELDGLPEPLRRRYRGSDRVIIGLQLHQGVVRKIHVGPDCPWAEADFTVAGDYKVAWRLFTGDLNPATAFANRLVRIEPLGRIYQRPRFTAKSIILAGKILQICRQIPTAFVPAGD